MARWNATKSMGWRDIRAIPRRRGGWGLVGETAESRPSPRGLDDKSPATRRMGVFPTAPAFTPVEDSGRATPPRERTQFRGANPVTDDGYGGTERTQSERRRRKGWRGGWGLVGETAESRPSPGVSKTRPQPPDR